MDIKFKVDGVTLPPPTDYTIELNQISEAERLENGDLEIEVITTKYKVTLNYAFISYSDFRVLSSELWSKCRGSKKIKCKFTMPDELLQEMVIDAYFSPYTATRTAQSDKARGYENVTVSFIEL